MVQGETSLQEKSVILFTWPTWSKNSVSLGSEEGGVGFVSSFYDDCSDTPGPKFPAID